MITLNKLDRKLAKLRETLNGVGKDFNKNLAVAVNDTSRFCKSQISKEIQSTGLNVTQKVIKSGLTDNGRANAARTSVEVTLKEGFRFGLDAFKARETKKGVTYRITKGGGASRIANAFIPRAFGGKVYIRKGKERGPLRQMRGVSPFGVFAKNKKESLVGKKTQAELIKQIERRIRFLLLKASGKI